MTHTLRTISDEQRQRWREQLEALCRTGNVTPAFQPIVSLESAEVVAFEALARPGKDSGFANPGELFDAAETCGMLWELEKLTRSKALAQAAEFPNGTVLFFNSSPQVLADKRFVEELNEELRTHKDLNPARLVLEITERSDEAQGQDLLGQVTTLKALGYRVAIDDVGAGTSGLNRMMSLRPQWLKLDRELVEGIDKDRYKINLLKFFVHFARQTGTRVIAEGIETQNELATLISLGIAYGQGFYLGRPQPTYQLLDPATRDLLRSRWIDSVVTPGGMERAQTLGSLVEPAKVVQAGAPLLEIANEILTDTTLTGVVVLDGRRFVGWCPREVILRCGAGAEPDQPIAYTVLPGVCTLHPDASIAEGLELASVRDESEFSAPLVISRGEHILGVVPLRALIGAAAGLSRSGWGRGAEGATALPGRVGCELRVRELIEGARLGPQHYAHGIDAAMIDIRHFADINAQLGYDYGDRMIQDLTELLLIHVMRPPPYGFIAHLGGDRFFVTGRRTEFQDLLDRACRAVEERHATELGSGSLPPGVGPLPGLRVLVMPEVFSRCEHATDIFKLEKQLRQALQSKEEQTPIDQSVLVRDDRDRPAQGVRLVA